MDPGGRSCWLDGTLRTVKEQFPPPPGREGPYTQTQNCRTFLSTSSSYSPTAVNNNLQHTETLLESSYVIQSGCLLALTQTGGLDSFSSTGSNSLNPELKCRVNGLFYFPFVADCFYYSCIHFLSYTPSPLSLDNVSRAGASDVNYRRIKICIRAAAGVP